MKNKIAITSDCVCDLSDDMLEKNGVEVIHFDITTDHGCFKDMDEITSANIVEYFTNGGQRIKTEAPNPQEYEILFEKALENSDEVIHIVITSSLSMSFKYANEAAAKFNGRVRVFDAGHLSTGIAHLVLKAAELVKEDKDANEIIRILDEMKNRVATSFIAENADYLYRTGRVSKIVMLACRFFKIHPILAMKNGNMKLKSIKIGNYEKAVMRYIRKELRDSDGIDRRRAFITHASCSVKLLAKAKQKVLDNCYFQELIVTSASATISSNCGANTLGVLFVRNGKR